MRRLKMSSSLDDLKETIERFQKCPVCKSWCAVDKIKKRKLKEENKKIPFECDNCGKEFTLQEVDT